MPFDLGCVCAGTQVEREGFSVKKSIQDDLLHAFFIILFSSEWMISCVRLDDMFPVVSQLPHLGIEKERHCQYRVLDSCAVHPRPPFDHVIAGPYKEGLCSSLWVRCMFAAFATRLSLHRVVWRGTERPFIVNRAVFPVKYAANVFTGKTI